MTVEILRIHEDHVTEAMFSLIQNGLLGGHQMLETGIRNVERGTECFFEVFLHVCEEERWHVLPVLIISFVRRRTTKRFPLSLTRQINY